MKEKPNPLAGIVDTMKAHANRVAATAPLTSQPSQASVIISKVAVAPVQTVAPMQTPGKAGDKVFCAARYTRGQIAKVDKIILLTHKERGVRLNQSDILKKAVDRMPEAPLEEGEVLEILAASRRKLLNG